MTIPETPKKAVVSVVEMSDMLGLSKSRFYTLIQAGIFPKPVRHEACKRPVFDADLQQTCLGIRHTGIGCNGQPVLFNRKRRKETQQKPRQSRVAACDGHLEIVEALKSLGLTASSEDVEAAVRDHYPNGLAVIDHGEVVRRVFLQLRGGTFARHNAGGDK
jgi:hypothetical protein